MGPQEQTGQRGATEADELPVDPDLAAQPAGAGRDPRSRRRGERVLLTVIAATGALGALARYGASRLVPDPTGGFPWGTFWINVAGSAAIGFVLVLLAEAFPRARVARPLVATGFLGAFTTFSTYTVGADLLVRGHHVATAAAYALSSVLAGIVAVGLGIVLARGLVRLDRALDGWLR